MPECDCDSGVPKECMAEIVPKRVGAKDITVAIEKP